jgi:hypothetical protein
MPVHEARCKIMLLQYSLLQPVLRPVTTVYGRLQPFMGATVTGALEVLG